jgi:hypothetical protein
VLSLTCCFACRQNKTLNATYVKKYLRFALSKTVDQVWGQLYYRQFVMKRQTPWIITDTDLDKDLAMEEGFLSKRKAKLTKDLVEKTKQLFDLSLRKTDPKKQTRHRVIPLVLENWNDVLYRAQECGWPKRYIKDM